MNRRSKSLSTLHVAFRVESFTSFFSPFLPPDLTFNLNKVFNNNNVLETFRRTAVNVFEVNQRFLYALHTRGKGLTTGRIIRAALNLPQPPTKFASCNKRLLDATTTVISISMAKAAEELKKEASTSDGRWNLPSQWMAHG